MYYPASSVSGKDFLRSSQPTPFSSEILEFLSLLLTFSEFRDILLAKGDSLKCDGTLLPEPLCEKPFFFVSKDCGSFVDSNTFL